MPRDSAEKRSFVAACAQFDVRAGDVAANLDAARAQVEAAAERNARLVVLPELWTTSFVPEVPRAMLDASRAADAEMAELSRSLGLVIVSGGLDAREGRLVNRALVLDHGKTVGAYEKIHLFTPNAENRHFDAGSEPLIVDTSVGRLGVAICYDIRFPELTRLYFCRGVEILAVPGQWPEARARHWRVLLQARAIENEMFVLGCNRTGIEPSIKTGDNLVFPGDSRIIDPMGQILESGTGDAEPVLAEIEMRKVRTMRRILPIRQDRRTDLYPSLWRMDIGPDEEPQDPPD